MVTGRIPSRAGAKVLLILVAFAAGLLFDLRGARGETFDYRTYREFLDRYIVQGKRIGDFGLNTVDYESIFMESGVGGSLYRRLLVQLADSDPAVLKERGEGIAFWINAYNISAIKMIIVHYPVDSIRSRKISWLKLPWGKKILEIGDARYSLGQIEDEILLGEFKEPMIHFAIVCASLSCPEISPEAYRGATLKDQMERQAQKFLSDEKKGLRIDREKGEVHFSQIFKFDKKTFPNGARDAIPLIGRFLEEADREYLVSGRYEVLYLDYDWSLNTSKRAH